jgi:hypothetical protein
MNMDGDLTSANMNNGKRSNSRDNLRYGNHNTLSLKKNLKEGGGRT